MTVGMLFLLVSSVGQVPGIIMYVYIGESEGSCAARPFLLGPTPSIAKSDYAPGCLVPSSK